MSRLLLLAPLLVAVLALPGCSLLRPLGGEREAQPPPGPPPSPPSRSGPPPAWIETEGGSVWLAYSGYCFGRTCVDFVSPEVRKDLPAIRVRRGEIVRFHFGFVARDVTLSVSENTLRSRSIRLCGGREVAWRVRRGGYLTIFMRARRGGDASYVARLVLGDRGYVGRRE